MRKAQTEIMGLVVIVIIAVVGMFFAMKFLVFKEPTIKTTEADRQLASAFLNVLLSDKLEITDCKQGIELQELFVDCASDKPNNCGGTETYCKKAEKVTAAILQETFDKRNKPYEFKVQKIGAPPKIKIGSCPKDRVQAPPYLIPTKDGTIELILAVCNSKI